MCQPKRYDFWTVESRDKLCLFWYGMWYGFWGIYVTVWTYLLFWSQINKTDRITFKFKVHFKKSFSWHSNLSNDNIISKRPGMKTGVKNAIFGSEIGSGFQELSGASSSRIPWSNAPSPLWKDWCTWYAQGRGLPSIL